MCRLRTFESDPLADELVHDVPGDVGETEITSLGSERESFVIDAHQVQ